MSEFNKAVQERRAKIDKIAAENVRRGMEPYEAWNAAANQVDDDAVESATGFRPRRVIPLTFDR